MYLQATWCSFVIIFISGKARTGMWYSCYFYVAIEKTKTAWNKTVHGAGIPAVGIPGATYPMLQVYERKS